MHAVGVTSVVLLILWKEANSIHRRTVGAIDIVIRLGALARIRK